MSKCPMDGADLTTGMVCTKCQREWEWKTIAGERMLASKPRRVEIVGPIVEGANINDVIKPI